MWPFSKKEEAPIEAMTYSQVDITEAFGDDDQASSCRAARVCMRDDRAAPVGPDGDL